VVQIFRPSANTIMRLALAGLAGLPVAGIGLAMGVVRSEYVTGRDRIPTQPVPFSHAHHSAEIGIDCRYCHTGVETSARAGIPPTATCMTCHSQLWTTADVLKPVRDSFATGKRMAWAPVNQLPDYAYFDHSIHVAKGVACTTCHGAVGEMKLTRQDAPLTMGWCLDCHRDPGPRLSPPQDIFAAFPARPDAADNSDTAPIHELLARYGVSTQGLTDCPVCHR